MRFNEAVAAFNADRAEWERRGVSWIPGAEPRLYVSNNPELGADYGMAMDALPTMVTDPNGGIPAMLSSTIDPEMFQVMFAPNKAEEIFGGAVQRGDWTQDVIYFPVEEAVGETSSYGDYSTSGMSGTNFNYPTRQNYIFQTIKPFGDREIERAALAKINLVSSKDRAAILALSKFTNYIYFYGVRGIENYGILNDPNLTAVLTPAPKAYGGTAWLNGVVVRATANEIYADIQAMVLQLVNQTAGLVNRETAMTLAIGPDREAAFTTTNAFGVNVSDLLKKNFPNLKIVTAMQYEASSATNNQGQAGGNLMQLIATELEGQRTGFCAYSLKMRAHPIVREISSYMQKVSAGAWGTILRMPAAVSGMQGI